jgi:hypothetical protein
MFRIFKRKKNKFQNLIEQQSAHAYEGMELLVKLKINVDRAEEGSVVIQTVADPEGAAQPYDEDGVTGGWTVTADGGVELVGASCELLRNPETIGIEFGFPCDIIVPK